MEEVEELKGVSEGLEEGGGEVPVAVAETMYGVSAE